MNANTMVSILLIVDQPLGQPVGLPYTQQVSILLIVDQPLEA